jgi:hypothetical protein
LPRHAAQAGRRDCLTEGLHIKRTLPLRHSLSITVTWVRLDRLRHNDDALSIGSVLCSGLETLRVLPEFRPARILVENNNAVAVAAETAAVEGHTLIVLKEHVSSVHALPIRRRLRGQLDGAGTGAARRHPRCTGEAERWRKAIATVQRVGSRLE